MQISREADYALRAILYLTRTNGGRPIATSIIADEQRIPPSFLTKIISRLSSAGIVRTSRGPHGGVSLARSSTDLSVLDVIEVIDGPIALNDCVTDPGGCPFGQTCSLHDVFCEAQTLLVDRWRQATFDLLIKANGQT
ncbi:MAG TPA: Rrf2 family transcriptional regulator [Anaerolineae bacterium]|nr:Rrf2 family transcriptional regulator [Anaerolineae bacterium]